MQSFLLSHPDSSSTAAISVEAQMRRAARNVFILSYIIKGKITEINLPAISAPRFGSGLWQRTCFEAFFRSDSTSVYYEFNFAPSTEWAAYQFNSYRTGMQMAREIRAPAIEIHPGPEQYILRASVTLDALTALPCLGSWRLGMSAIIEDIRGGKSFWAMAHPPGKPDFHHLDCFAHEFSPW